MKTIFFIFLIFATTLKAKAPKNLILVIGDGMGPQQISLLYYFAKYSQLNIIEPNKFAFKRLADKGRVGISATEGHGKLVVDSACSATQLASGNSSRPEMIGLDIEGNRVETILEKAKKKGMGTGLVSDTRITHATPASFAAHVGNRWYEDQIAEELLNSNTDILLSAGANRFVPKGFKQTLGHFVTKSRRKDNKNLLEKAKKNNYELIFDRNKLLRSKSKKILGLFENHEMPSSMWQNRNWNSPDRKTPNLLEMSKVAVRSLSKNKNGYFLMIEGGQIDWAAHANDAGRLLHEMVNMNKVLNWLIDWVDKNPDTLLVVTADHETGGFGLGYNILNIPKGLKLSGSAFKNKKYKVALNYGEYSSLDKLYQQKQTFKDIWKKFKKLPKKKQTPRRYKVMIENTTGYPVSMKEAKKILESEPNRFRVRKHYTLGSKTRPKIHEFTEFFNGDVMKMRSYLISTIIAPKQNITWATGGHTSTPVNVFAYGKDSNWLKPYGGFLTHPKLGELMQESLNLK